MTVVCMVPPRYDHERRIAALARTLPCVLHVPGATAPFMPKLLDHLLATAPEKFTPAELAAGRFLLAVWDGVCTWRSGRFDAAEALAVWDAEHRRAYAAWAAKPWWIRPPAPVHSPENVFPLR